MRVRTIVTSAGLVMSLALGAPAWSGAGSPPTARLRIHPDNPRYLQDAEGRTVFLLGFGNEQKNQPRILDRLSGKINYQRAYVTWFHTRGSSDEYERGTPFKKTPCGRWDLDRWEEPFWAQLQSHIESAEERGIIVGLTVWDGHSALPGGKFGLRSLWNRERNLQGVQWAYDFWALVRFDAPRRDSSDPRERLVYYQKRFVDRLIRETRGHANVLYEIDNEGPRGHERWFLYWAEYLKHHTGFVVAATEARGGAAISDATLADTSYVDMKSYHFRSDRSLTPARLRLNKIVVADADNSCANLEASAARRIAWRALLRGGHWNDFVCADRDFPDPRKLDAYGHLLRFLRTRSVPLAGMAPADELVSAGHALVRRGSHYLTWVDGEIGLDLTDAEGPLRYEWYDPRTGIMVEEGQVSGGTVVHFRRPRKVEFVLWVHVEPSDDDDALTAKPENTQ